MYLSVKLQKALYYIVYTCDKGWPFKNYSRRNKDWRKHYHYVRARQTGRGVPAGVDLWPAHTFKQIISLLLGVF